MRVIIILAAIALTHGAKLERTYLPPSNARTAGGSGNFLQTPISGPSGNSATTIQRNYNAQPAFDNGIFQSGNDFPQSGNTFAQSGNEFAQSGNDFAQSGNDYAQSGNGFSQSGNDFSQTEAQYGNVNFANEARPERPRAAFERNAAILRQDNSNDGEQYSYAYETENGIYAEENGVATNGVEAQGGYSYTGDDGQVYSVRYTADQNGFVPQGDHLPTPPPVPEEILKALEQNARDEAAGIYDDGSYNEGKYGSADNNNYNNKFNYQQNNGYNGNDDDSVVTNSAFTRSGNNFNAPSGNAGIAPTYNVRNATPNSDIAPTYGAPSENAPRNVYYNVPSENTPIATYDAPAQNTRSYNAPNAGNTQSFNTPTDNTLFAPKSGTAQKSGVEKSYLPPFADQRGQARDTFGRRQQSFDARTGYKY